MRIRRCLQFSLRSWMLLITTICLLLAWHARTEQRRKEAIQAIEAMGGEVVAYDPTGADTVYIMFHLRHTRVSAAGRAALCQAMPNCQIDVSP